MPQFPTAWRDIANDPYGEALDARFYVRADTDGDQVDEVFELTQAGVSKVLSVSPVSRRRQRKFGVVQGQAFGVKLDNSTGALNPRSPDWPFTDNDLIDKWALLEVGFRAADEWVTLAQGKVRRYAASGDGTVSITVGDILMDALNVELSRDTVFDERDAHIGPIRTLDVSPATERYDNDGNPPEKLWSDPTSVLINAETFKIVFTSSTEYKIVEEDLTEQTGKNIFTDATVLGGTGHLPIVKIPAAGWGSGGFFSGDEFVFYTSPKVTQTGPVQLIQTILQKIVFPESGADSSIDFFTGNPKTIYHNFSPSGDGLPAWTDYNTAFQTFSVRGSFEVGTNVMELIQGLLKITLATIWPSNEGQIGVWFLHPDSFGFVNTITGDPTDTENTVLQIGREMNDSLLMNKVLAEYFNLSRPLVFGKLDLFDEAFADVVQVSSPYNLKPFIFDSPWAVAGALMQGSANRLLFKFGQPNDTFRVRGTMVNVSSAQLGERASIADPILDETGLSTVVTSVTMDPTKNEAQLECEVDRVANSLWAYTGSSLTDDPDLVW